MVDDGSSDNTAGQAGETSARVLSLSPNQGKASAMDRGVEAARNEVIFFLDADIHGLTPEGIETLIEPVISGRVGMFVGIRDRHVVLLNSLLRFTPILGGERVLTRELWKRVPNHCKRNFQIEIALNYFAKRLGYGMDFEVIPGLNHVKKEKKHGFWRGLWERLRMFGDLLLVSSRIYLLGNECRPVDAAEPRQREVPRIGIFYDRAGGQTEKIARRLSDIFDPLGIEGEAVLLSRTASDLSPERYDGFILGGSVRGGRHNRALSKFLRWNWPVLTRIPGFFFSVSLSAAGKPERQKANARRCVHRFLERTGWNPSRTAIFGGALRYRDYNPVLKWMMKSMAGSAGGDTDTSRNYEYTDWNEVEAFAHQCIEDLELPCRLMAPNRSEAVVTK